MKKWIVGSLVGAIIVFAWQFLSWDMLNLHAAEQKYSSAQDQIMTTLNSSNLEDGGMYLMPIAPTQKETRELMSNN